MKEKEMKYEELEMGFYTYQKMTEDKIQQLSESNMKLEKRLNSLYNVIEVSNYINSFLSSENLIPMINDMIVGILGVTQCTIYILENNEFVVKSTSWDREDIWLTEKCIEFMEKHDDFIINSKSPIRMTKGTVIKEEEEIHSRMGVPIKIREKFIGYIILDHTHYNFFTVDHEVFVNAICNQIAIAIENSILYSEIKNAARVDPLIGIYNRKTFFEIINNKIKEENENENPEKHAIIMIDLDNFKRINDTLGHQFGDTVLVNTSNLIKGMLESVDIIARYGGEELIIYIDNGENETEVFARVEAIRKAIELNRIEIDGVVKYITASFGVSYYPKDGNGMVEIIRAADRLLYKSKYSGKNKVMSSHMFK